MLAHNEGYNGPEATKEAKYREIYVRTEDMQHKIAAAHYPILHTFLALALAYHTGVHSLSSAKAIGEILSAAYQTRADYSELKKRKETLARAIAKRAKERGITTDEDKTAKVMEEAFDKAFKIIDKIAPDHKKENLAILARAISASTDDPFVVLRNAGIDIEPELEEFRQFLAEISGKKIEGKKSAPKLANSGVSPELLAIAKALEYSGFSSDALKRAEEDLLRRLDVLLENPEGNALEIAYTVKLLRLVQRGEVDKIREFSK